jgi:hypothetical protein
MRVNVPKAFMTQLLKRPPADFPYLGEPLGPDLRPVGDMSRVPGSAECRSTGRWRRSAPLFGSNEAK